jgi:acetyl esterase/lipase
MPGACVLLSPWIDLGLQSETVRTLADVDPTLRSESLAAYAKQYLQDANAPAILDADLSGLPPVLIQAGGDEILAGDSMRLNAALAAAGNRVVLEVWPGLFHVWHAYAPWLKEGRDAIARVGEFLQRTLK